MTTSPEDDDTECNRPRGLDRLKYHTKKNHWTRRHQPRWKAQKILMLIKKLHQEDVQLMIKSGLLYSWSVIFHNKQISLAVEFLYACMQGV